MYTIKSLEQALLIKKMPARTWRYHRGNRIGGDTPRDDAGATRHPLADGNEQ